MKNLVFALIISLFVCLIAIDYLTGVASPYFIKQRLLPPRYMKNSNTEQNIIDTGTENRSIYESVRIGVGAPINGFCIAKIFD